MLLGLETVERFLFKTHLRCREVSASLTFVQQISLSTPEFYPG